MKKLLLLLLFFPLFFAAGAVGQGIPSPMEVLVSRLDFENMEQWTGTWQGEIVIMASMEKAVLRGQVISNGPLRLDLDKATVENLLMCAADLVCGGSHFENTTMYLDPQRGLVIRIRSGWMENVYAPSYYIIIKNLYHENLWVSVA